jgi:hypothetical protein
MSAELVYGRSDETALITPDALRLRFKQSGFPAELRQTEEGPDLHVGDKVVLLLGVESGFVDSIVLDATFVDAQSQKRTGRVCELLESMGWLRGE